MGTFNIHGCRGPDRVCDAGRTAECLPRLSLAGLNEVHHELWAPCQATELGDALGMTWLFAPTERHHFREGFGNAVLSRLPVRAWRRIPLVNTRGKAFRNLVEVECDWNGQTMWLLVTHLDRRDDRLPQLQFVAERFLNTPAPAILLGDFNTRGDEAELRALLSAPGVHDLVAEGLATRADAQITVDDPPSEIEAATTKNPLARIDWILGRGLRGTRAGVVERGASDHPAYWAEVERIAPLADASPADASRAAKANHNKKATVPR